MFWYRGVLIFFDPLGGPPSRFFSACPTGLSDIKLHVQPDNSVYCGNYCLFILHVVRRLQRRGCAHVAVRGAMHDVVCSLRRHVTGYLHVLGHPDFNANDMVMELFTTDYGLGEEFHEEGGIFTKYMTDLSRSAMDAN